MADESDSNSNLEQRVVGLEQRLAKLEAEIARLGRQDIGREQGVSGDEKKETSGQRQGEAAPVFGPSSKKRPPARPSAPREPRPPSAARMALDKALKSEDLISKIGIGLLLISVAFLFKLGIDRGWITPPVRVGVGFALGSFLVVAGVRLAEQRERLSQVLVGGGIATFYITLFSAYQLFGLLSYPVSFGLMMAVTALSFGLAIRQRDVVLAIIATAGGLGTPFLLFTPGGSLLWLVVYTCLIIASAIGVYFDRGWRLLLVVTVVGGWAVFTYVANEIASIRYVLPADRITYQFGVVFCLAAFGVVPVIRDVWQRRNPDRWVVPPPRKGFGDLFFARPAIWIAVVAPLVTLALSREIWDIPNAAWGVIEVVVATAYWAAYLFLRSSEESETASAVGVAAAIVLAVSWFDLFDDASFRLIALGAEAAALHLSTYTSSDRALRVLGHLFFLLIAFWMVQRLTDAVSDPNLVSVASLAHILVLVLAMTVGVTLTEKEKTLADAYRIAVILLVGLLWFTLFADGSVRFVILAVQAAGVMAWTSLSENRGVRLTGHLLFGVLLLAAMMRLSTMNAATPPFLNGPALADLVVIVLAGGVSWLFSNRQVRLTYRFGAYIAFLGLVWRELQPLDDGQAFISLVWGVAAIALIVVGWRTGLDIARKTGLGTLGIVIVKLFVIDLAEINAVWRVILFAALGSLLLFVSYLFPSIWRGEEEEESKSEVRSQTSDLT